MLTLGACFAAPADIMRACVHCAAQPPPMFTIADASGRGDVLELIGPSRWRHDGHLPSLVSLERVLAASRNRHRELGIEVSELSKARARAWNAAELKTLKKRRLREKDKVAQVLSLMRRHPQYGGGAWTLGSGHFGEVMLGRSETHGRVAIKVAPLVGSGGDIDAVSTSDVVTSELASDLASEAAVLSAMGGEQGFPKLYYYGRQTVFGRRSEVLVLELLGSSVDDLCWSAVGGTNFPASAVVHLGRQLLYRLRALHQAGFVHNDLKPSNVLLGAPGGGRERLVHLVDFGIATRVPLSLQAGEGSSAAMPADAVGAAETDPSAPASAPALGTLLFASSAAHRQRSTRPIDDIESLVYMLAYLSIGRLPWQGATAEGVASQKQRLLSSGTCEDLLGAMSGGAADGGGSSSGTAAEDRQTMTRWCDTALRALWQQVTACNAASDAAAGADGGGDTSPPSVDYDACLAALSWPGGRDGAEAGEDTLQSGRSAEAAESSDAPWD